MATYRAVVVTGDKVEQGLMRDWGSMLVAAETPEEATAMVAEVMTGQEYKLARLFEADDE
jgi:phage terminase large subunit-like protein